jgi:hypothetical protein
VLLVYFITTSVQAWIQAIAVSAISSGRGLRSAREPVHIVNEFFGQRSVPIYRVDKHLQGNILLELFAKHEVDELFGEGALLVPLRMPTNSI